MRDGAAIGAIGIISWDAGGFPDSQVELMKTFAEQAVIAISSAATSENFRTGPRTSPDRSPNCRRWRRCCGR